MNNNKVIGLMGCLTCNMNMGCSALTYTMLQMLEEIGERKFQYQIFDIDVNEQAINRICKEINIERSRINVIQLGSITTYKPKKAAKAIIYIKKNLNNIQQLKKCQLVIDITQGDSFTDIYGIDRFYYYSSFKMLVLKLNIPLILGPQTYGPFNEKKCKKYAKRLIENSELVISRDKTSKEYVETFCKMHVVDGTDLAFGLKYNKYPVTRHSGKIRIGLNISGLLHSNRNDGSDFDKGTLKTDYDRYIDLLLKYLVSDNKYEVYLIPHVGNDANPAFVGKYDKINIHPEFKSPIEAKSFISTMDLFIGARMHATIAAFSSGVATIPVAYSRKFSGLFQSLGYNCLVDLQSMSTEQALEKTIFYLENWEELRKGVRGSQHEIEKKYRTMKKSMEIIVKKHVIDR